MDNKKLKAVLVVGSLRMGGAERMMINLANELSSHAEVILVQLTRGKDLVNEIAGSVRFVSLERERTLGAFFPLCRLLKLEKPDALISTQVHVNIACMLVKIFCSIRTKIILREATTPGAHFDRNRSLRTMITRAMMRRVYPKADAVVANSEAVQKDLIINKFAPDAKVKLIYNPVITGNFKNRISEDRSHKFFGEAKVFISVGRLAAAKNFTLLIHAFAKVLDKTDARLIIAGEGPERKNLEALTKELDLGDKIDFMGQVQNPFPLVRKADVFVLSSDYEGLPNSLIEAMACGTQVVSTDSEGGAGEILMNGALGILVPVNNAAALAEAMLEALEKKISKEELIRSTERFDAGNAAREYFSLIGKLCDKQ